MTVSPWTMVTHAVKRASKSKQPAMAEVAATCAVGRCRLTVSEPVLKVPTVPVLEAKI
jgi:hypothetical protein